MHAVLYTLIEDAQRYQALAQRADEVSCPALLTLVRMKNWQRSCLRSHGRATTVARKPRGCSPSEWPSTSRTTSHRRWT
jgi:hypothetical protein